MMELEAEKAVQAAVEDLEIEEVNLGGNLSKQTTIVMCQVKFGLNTTLFFFQVWIGSGSNYCGFCGPYSSKEQWVIL